MNTTLRSLLVVTLLLHATVTSGDAQQARTRHVWTGLGLGYGSATFTCSSCDYRRATGTNDTHLTGWDISMGLGWKSDRHVGVGIEYHGWLNGLKADDSLPGLDIGSLVLSYAPLSRRRLFLEGGAAITHYTLGLGTGDPIEPHQRTDDFAAGYGWGYRFGVGWQGRSAFTPRVTYVRGKEPRLHAADGGTVATGWRQDMLLVEVVWRASP